MKDRLLTTPELAFIIGTRVALGAGIGLLVSNSDGVRAAGDGVLPNSDGTRAASDGVLSNSDGARAASDGARPGRGRAHAVRVGLVTHPAVPVSVSGSASQARGDDCLGHLPYVLAQRPVRGDARRELANTEIVRPQRGRDLLGDEVPVPDG